MLISISPADLESDDINWRKLIDEALIRSWQDFEEECFIRWSGVLSMGTSPKPIEPMTELTGRKRRTY